MLRTAQNQSLLLWARGDKCGGVVESQRGHSGEPSPKCRVVGGWGAMGWVGRREADGENESR